jgi:sulfopyruvate decarboxylase alpha subunit
MTTPAWASGVCDGVHAAGSRDVVYVPDNPLSHVLRVFEERFPDVRLLLATREEEALGIAAGLYLGRRLPTVMLQSSGIGNSLNVLTSLLLPYQIPVLMVVSMRGDAGEWNAAQVPMGRAVRSIFDAIAIPHATVESPDRARETVLRAGQTAFSTRVTTACLLPRRLTVSDSNSGTDSDTGLRHRTPAPVPGTGARYRYLVPTGQPRDTMTRLEATRVIVDRAGDAAIIASLGHPAYDLFAAGDRPQNFYTWGSMGMASSIGLGLALAQADLRVFVLDGDGSLLMNLGSLATIGLLQPSNLVLVVMDNEEYATTGGQKTPTARGADLEAAARAMGIASSVTVRSEDELTRALDPEGPALPGAMVIVAKVQESAPTVKPPLDYVAIKERFMAAVGGR